MTRTVSARASENTPRAWLLIVLVVLILAPAVHAGIADSPLPVLVTGKKTLHLYSVLGVASNASVATIFTCTSTDTVPQQVGVEVFGGAGGGPANDATTTSVSVVPGGTAVIETQSTTYFGVDSNLATSVGNRGSARILSTSKKLACTAIVADSSTAPPSSTWPLTIIKKIKEKGE